MSVNDLFADYKDTKIALYGLGVETEKALREFGGDYKIVGLLDGFREEGELYGKGIISLQDAIEKGVRLIIAVARPGSCRAIAKRIGNICRENDIALIDICGKDLLEAAKVVYDFSNISGVTKAELNDKIQKADVISFDLFDTLIMRRTLSSDDVADYVNCRLKEKGIFIEDFCKKRLESEKDLSKNTAPTLTEIYHDMLSKMENADKINITPEQMAELEWSIDFDLIIPREEVCKIFREAVADSRKTYIVSDTYYNKDQLIEILKKCGITEYTDIMASCEYRTGKTQNLFSFLKDREGDRKYLHVGDDIVADIENAHKWGFETCRLFSGLDLMEYVGNLGLAEYTNLLSERLKVGMFIAGIFNSPFQFENEDRHIRISDSYDIGYLICAPMISDFVLWFYQQMREHNLKNIWLGARDGYLIKKLHAYLAESHKKDDRTVYFLTSRTAAIRAGIKDEKDIRYVDEMKFSGTLEESLKERFGIDADTIKSESILDNESGLMKYKAAILEKAHSLYENYKKYIIGLNVREGDIAFFDFVAKGTSQMYIQRLVNNHIKGFYFLQLEAEHMKDYGLDISSFYGNDDMASCAIFDNYYILETILTAPHSSVQEFDDNGQPVYAAETRCKKDIQCFQRAQEGIQDYFRNYIKLCPETEKVSNKKLDEEFLKLIHSIKITDSDFLSLMVEDPFFNRMTNITDVIYYD